MQSPLLAVPGLIKKPRAARLQAPSTDLRDLLTAQLSQQATAERRLYLPLIRPASLVPVLTGPPPPPPRLPSPGAQPAPVQPAAPASATAPARSVPRGAASIVTSTTADEYGAYAACQALGQVPLHVRSLLGRVNVIKFSVC